MLDSQGLLYYYSQKDNLLSKLAPGGRGGPHAYGTPQTTVALITSTVKLDDDDGLLKFCFRLISPEATYTLQAKSDAERQGWVETIQVRGVVCLAFDLTLIFALPFHPPGCDQLPSHHRRLCLSEQGINALIYGQRRAADGRCALINCFPGRPRGPGAQCTSQVAIRQRGRGGRPPPHVVPLRAA